MKAMRLWILGLLMATIATADLQAQGWEKHFQGSVAAMEQLQNGDVLIWGCQAFNGAPDTSIVRRVDVDGNVLWLRKFYVDTWLSASAHFYPGTRFPVEMMEELDNGNILLGGSHPDSADLGSLVLIELDSAGTLLRQHTFWPSEGFFKVGLQDIAADDYGHVVISYNQDNDSIGNDFDFGMCVLDSSWNIVSNNAHLISNLEPQDIQFISDSTLLLAGNYYNPDSSHSFRGTLFKFGLDGSIMEEDSLLAGRLYNDTDMKIKGDRVYTIALEYGDTSRPPILIVHNLSLNSISEQLMEVDSPWTVLPMSIDVLGDTVIYVSGLAFNYESPAPSTAGFYCAKYDTTGSLIWFYTDTRYQSLVCDVVGLEEGGVILMGHENTDPDVQVLMRLGANGEPFFNTVNISVFYDADADCTRDSLEPGKPFQLVEAVGTAARLMVTLPNGRTTFYVDSTAHSFKLHGVPAYWSTLPCSDSLQTVHFNEYNVDTTLEFGLSPLVSCPNLQLNVGTWRLRRCMSSSYIVSLVNLGTIASYDTEVMLVLDPYLSYNTSSIPISAISGDTLWFDLDTMEVFESKYFTVELVLSCSAPLSITHTVYAHAYPDSSCLPPPAIWDGSLLRVAGTCYSPDSVEFRVENIGSGDMSDPAPLLVIEDDIMLMSTPIKLNAGQSLRYTQPANGSTWRYTALNTPGNPIEAFSTHAVEACGTSPTGAYSTGFVMDLPEDDEPAYIDIEQTQNTGSYDPNDKTSYPEGTGLSHIIEANTPIEYRIRFQNTGTDTAFNVYILDTINTSVLDITSIQVLNASHPYTWHIKGTNIVEFRFSNIMLPDSNASGPNSHGFVKYTIDQLPDLAEGTIIPNRASIYFDFNEPVHTNTAFNTIGEIYIMGIETVEGSEIQQINAYPNPFSDYTFIELKGAVPQAELNLMVYDLSGREVKKVGAANTNAIRLDGAGLSAGSFVFEIWSGQQKLGQGKLVVQ